MIKLVRVAKRFPRAVPFLGDYTEVKLGSDYATWQREFRVKFHELGWPHVYDADRLFEAMPRTADGIHFLATSETTANINSIMSVVIRHASTLLPWDWMKLQCQ